MNPQLESHIVELDRPRSIVTRTEFLDLSSLKPEAIAAKTLYSVISPGTEVAAYKGDPPLRPMKVYPRVVGYCNVAEVVAVGEAVKDYGVGDKILNFQSHRSAFICSQDTIATKIPDGADLRLAATTYLFHLGYNALLKGDFKPGMNVAVVGLGTLGLTSISVASSFGGNVFGFSNQDSSHKRAIEFGAKKVFRKDGEEILSQVRQETDGVGVDLVISTSGSWQDWKLALSLARKEGTICVLGFPGRTQPIADFNPLDSRYFYDSQLRLVCCGYTPDLSVPPHDIRFTLKRNCKYLLGRVLDGKLPAKQIISTSVPWTGLREIYEAMAAREPSILTALLEWNV